MRAFFLRFLCLILGLYLLSLGIVLATRPNIGTTAISSAPYVMHLISGLSFGATTLIFNLLFTIAQIAILRRHYRLIYLLELLPLFLFGAMIDAWMHLFSWLSPHFYGLRLFFLLLGIILMALGVATLALSNTAMLPADSLVRTISTQYEWNFGRVKLIFDCTQVLLALLLSLIFLHRLEGVREGTVIAALTVGPFIQKIISYLKKRQAIPI